MISPVSSPHTSSTRGSVPSSKLRRRISDGGGRDGIHVHDERRPTEPARQGLCSSKCRTGGNGDEHHVGEGRGFSGRVLNLHVTTRTSSRLGTLIGVVGGDPGRTRCVQVKISRTEGLWISCGLIIETRDESARKGGGPGPHAIAQRAC